LVLFIFPILSSAKNTSVLSVLPDKKKDTVPIYCEADKLEYVKGKGTIEGFGNVVINYKEVAIYSQYVKVDFDSDIIKAAKDIIFMSRDEKIIGDTIVYNMQTKKGDIDNASTCFPPMYYKGKKIIKNSDENFEVKSGLFTTCDLDKPHYSMRAKRINVDIGKRILASNVSVYAGEIPVFYFPFLVFPLTDKAVSWFFPTVGYSAEKGIWAKMGYNYSPSPSLYGNVFAEYMQLKGFGIGSENQLENKKWSGASSLYYFRQGDLDRYKINLQAQPTNSNSFFYSYYISDLNFDREFGPYFGPPSSWVKRKFTTYISLTDEPSPKSVKTKFDVKMDESVKEGFVGSVPKFTIFTNPNKMGNLPLTAGYSSSIGNYYYNGDNYALLSGGANFTTNSIDILQGLNLNSNLNLQGIAYSRYNTDLKGLAGGYKLSIGPRYHPFRDLHFLVYYNLDSQIEEDTYAYKTIPDQYLSSLLFYSNKYVESSISGNYDLLSRDPLAERFKKVCWDLNVNLQNGVQLISSTKYNVVRQNTLQNVSYVYVGKNNWSLTFGEQYSAYTAGTLAETIPQFDLTSEFRTTFGAYKFIFSTSFNVPGNQFRDRDYILTRDLHCWEASIIYRELRSEVWFQFGIKAFPGVGVTFLPKIF